MKWKSVVIACLFGVYAYSVPEIKLSQRQELVINNGAEPESLDPSLAETKPAHDIILDLFEGLTTSNNEGDVIAGVAESWERVDNETWRFRIRDAKWSNGEKVTVEDVVFGAKRLFDPKVASNYAGTYAIFIQGAMDAVQGTGSMDDIAIKAIDDRTVEFKTLGSVPFLPEILSSGNFNPLPKAVIDRYGSDWTKPQNIVSNGAFKLQTWEVNNRIVLIKNPEYWDSENVTLNKITFLSIESATSALQQYRTDQIDTIDEIPPGQLKNLKTEFADELQVVPILGVGYYSLNVEFPELKDKRVRHALSMVIDREVMMNNVAANGFPPYNSLQPRGIKGSNEVEYEWNSWPMDQRIQYARDLLQEAEFDVKTQNVSIIFNTNDLHSRLAGFIASEWQKKLGLRVKSSNMEFKTLVAERHARNYSIARNAWLADYNDATTFLTLVQCNSPQNDTGYCNPRVDELVESSSNIEDEEERAKILTEATRIAMDDYPIIPLYLYSYIQLTKPKVGGMKASEKQVLQRVNHKFVYIKE